VGRPAAHQVDDLDSERARPRAKDKLAGMRFGGGASSGLIRSSRLRRLARVGIRRSGTGFLRRDRVAGAGSRTRRYPLTANKKPA